MAKASRAGTVAWRLGIGIGGLAVVLVGLLLLVFPGPGWLVIFLGLGIWATEFAWARRLLEWSRARVFELTAWVASRPRWLQALGSLGVVAGIGTVALAYLRWQQWWPFG